MLTKDEYTAIRHRLIMQAELARELGDLTEFVLTVETMEPDRTKEELLWLANRTTDYQVNVTGSIRMLKAGRLSEPRNRGRLSSPNSKRTKPMAILSDVIDKCDYCFDPNIPRERLKCLKPSQCLIKYVVEVDPLDSYDNLREAYDHLRLRLQRENAQRKAENERLTEAWRDADSILRSIGNWHGEDHWGPAARRWCEKHHEALATKA